MTGKEITKKLQFFKDGDKQVHISCGERFYNGKILEINFDKELLVLMDNKLGEIPILFEEIIFIEGFREEGGE